MAVVIMIEGTRRFGKIHLKFSLGVAVVSYTTELPQSRSTPRDIE